MSWGRIHAQQNHTFMLLDMTYVKSNYTHWKIEIIYWKESSNKKGLAGIHNNVMPDRQTSFNRFRQYRYILKIKNKGMDLEHV